MNWLTDEGDITETESSIELNFVCFEDETYSKKKDKKDKFSHSAP